MWVYRKSKQGGSWLYTVGYWSPRHAEPDRYGDHWNAVEDFTDEQHARQLVNYLNGGGGYLPSCQP